MNIYVGNLSFQTESHDLEELFSQYGQVTSMLDVTKLSKRPYSGHVNFNDAGELIFPGVGHSIKISP